MNKLQQQKLIKLNELLMEQERPASMRRAAARRSRGDTKQSPQSVEKSDLLDKAEALLALKGGQEVLKKALKKAGVKVGKDQVKKSFLRRTIQRLGPRALIALAGDIAAFQALSAEAGILATAGAAGAGLTTAAVGAAIVAGTAAGTAIGYGLNKAFTAADLKGEVEERITKAKKDLDYAKAELDIYCKGQGSLCGDDVKCSGKPGGYVYETAEGLGIGAGRELFGVPGFRKFKQLAYQFHSNDGAVMIGLAAALTFHDLKNDKIVLPNKENKLKVAKFKPGAASKQYEKCIKKWITGSNVMINSVGKLGLGDAYESLRLVYGLKAFPVDLPDEKKTGTPKGPTKGKCDKMPITKGCTGAAVSNMIHIIAYGTKTGIEQDQNKVETLKKKQTLDDETIKFIETILSKDAPEILAKLKKNNFRVNPEDAISKWFDETSSKFGLMAENKNSLNESTDFYKKISSKRNKLLQQKLMEQIK
tara:strand:+ start:2237 stop:3667 length:1431 start_codon:yes stop_codon:yes gene_type:complete